MANRERQLYDLLAFIHQDDGRYTDASGYEESFAAAFVAILTLRKENQELLKFANSLLPDGAQLIRDGGRA